MPTFPGALTALITPFHDDRVDERALRELVDFQIESGIDGLVPCGTTGESVNLDDAEYSLVVRTVVEQAKGRVPVIAGSGTASTRRTIAFSRAALEAGADGLLVVAPYYNRPTQEGLYAHFVAVSDAVPLPIVLYNIPGRCGVDVLPDTLAKLAAIDRIVAVKEATGDVGRSVRLLARFGERFTLLSGDDALALPIMAAGGHGVISVASNVAPAEVASLVHHMRDGSVTDARAQAQRLAPLFDALFLETSPGPVKAALAMCGRASDQLRLPLVRPREATLAQLRAALEGLGLT